MGGASSEREISLKSGKAVLASLQNAGYAAVGIDIQTHDPQENIRHLKSHGIDSAFVALHGRFGEDGGIQKILESLKIPYTGSGVEASRLAMDKLASREIFSAHGLTVPRHKVLRRGKKDSAISFALPVVVKPAGHGSSIGLSIVDKEQDLAKAVELALSFDAVALVEEYIPGREVTVGVLAEEALPVIEIIPQHKFFDFEAKYKSGLTEYKVPAVLPNQLAKSVKEAGLRAHQLLGCRGCSRTDIILNAENIPVVLEVNTIPGFTETSLLPKAAQSLGIDFLNLCLKLLELAHA
jgi:D-alanine--D-alanine ligase